MALDVKQIVIGVLVFLVLYWLLRSFRQEEEEGHTYADIPAHRNYKGKGQWDK